MSLSRQGPRCAVEGADEQPNGRPANPGRYWAQLARCEECGTPKQAPCYDENDNPTPSPCKGRRAMVPRVLAR